MTLPLLEGTDGVAKMSKSLGNAIGIADPPDEIFGKIMSISDTMMLRYYELLTSDDVSAFRAQIESGALHPMEAKKQLARQIVARFYDEPTGRRALEGFESRFQRRELPEDLPRFNGDQPPDVVPIAAERCDGVGDRQLDERGAALDPAGSSEGRRRADRKPTLRVHA